MRSKSCRVWFLTLLCVTFCGLDIDFHLKQSFPASLATLRVVPVSRSRSSGHHIESLSHPPLLVFWYCHWVWTSNVYSICWRNLKSVFSLYGFILLITTGKHSLKSGHKKYYPLGNEIDGLVMWLGWGKGYSGVRAVRPKCFDLPVLCGHLERNPFKSARIAISLLYLPLALQVSENFLQSILFSLS